MLQDLAAVTPPLVVGVAFLVGVFLFLRRQMGAPRRSADDSGEADIQRDDNSRADAAGVLTTDSEGSPASDPRHSSR